MTCSSCPQGSYCPSEVQYPTQCPANTTSYTQSKSRFDCSCLPGFTPANSSAELTGGACVACNSSQFCSGGAANACPAFSSIPIGSLGVTSRDCVCWLGYYSLNGNCTLCPSNYICPYNMSSPTSCPSNSQSQSGQFSFSACACNAGFMNTNTDNTTAVICSTCAANAYCAGGRSNIVSGFCPANSASPAGSSLIAQCTCNTGYYGNASVACSLCPSGFYTLTATNAASCLSCLSGTFSNAWPAVGITNCTPCPAGYYTEQPNSTTCRACPAGTWSNLTGSYLSSQCLPCPPGTFSPNTGLNASSLCTKCGVSLHFKLAIPSLPAY